MKSVTSEYIVSETKPNYNFRFKAYYIDSIQWPIVDHIEEQRRVSYDPHVPVEYKNFVTVEWYRLLYTFDPVVPKPRGKSTKRYYVYLTKTWRASNFNPYRNEIFSDTMIVHEPLLDSFTACNDIKENERFICIQVR